MRTRPGLLALLFSATLPLAAPAQVRLCAPFGDGMVLQQGRPVPVRGLAGPGEEVTVSLGEQRAVARADGEGRWRALLGPLPAGGPYTMTVAGSTELAVRDILVGEVWLCSGQSNMEWPLRSARDGEQEVAQAADPLLRLFTVLRRVSSVPQAETEGGWAACTPESAARFSAAGYFFGRHLRRSLGVPVGLLNASWGGTPSEAWTSAPTVDTDPAFGALRGRWEKILAGYPRARDAFLEAQAAWTEAAAKAKAEGRPAPPRPRPPLGPDHPHRPASLFNGMIAPLTAYGIQGVLWYQGEANAGRAFEYRSLFPALIQDWRRAWGQGDFPFLYVQLANFDTGAKGRDKEAWAELREAQALALRLPATGMAVAIDIGESRDIHPRNKQEVGRRLGLIALAKVYGKELAHSGPVFAGMEPAAGGRLRLSFEHTRGGLEAPGEPRGFQVAGEDRVFHPARALLEERGTVLVWSEAVPAPVAVRYAWLDDPGANLRNKEGLPAAPFRTDSWPGVTEPGR